MGSKRKRKNDKCRHIVVAVYWIDADEDSGWQTYTNKSAWIIKTIGYLIAMPKKKTDFIVLGNSHLPDTDQWSGVTRIPKGMVLSVETLVKNVLCGETNEDSGNPRHPD
jgi:hypothetical protein